MPRQRQVLAKEDLQIHRQRQLLVQGDFQKRHQRQLLGKEDPQMPRQHQLLGKEEFQERHKAKEVPLLPLYRVDLLLVQVQVHLFQKVM